MKGKVSCLVQYFEEPEASTSFDASSHLIRQSLGRKVGGREERDPDSYMFDIESIVWTIEGRVIRFFCCLDFTSMSVFHHSSRVDSDSYVTEYKYE